MLHPQREAAVTHTIMNFLFEAIIEHDRQEADDLNEELAEVLSSDVWKQAPTKGAALLALSYQAAKILESFIEDAIPKVPHNFNTIILTDEEHARIISNACLAAVGKLIGHFLHATPREGPSLPGFEVEED